MGSGAKRPADKALDENSAKRALLQTPHPATKQDEMAALKARLVAATAAKDAAQANLQVVRKAGSS